MSARSLFNSLPTANQFKGFTEFIFTRMSISEGAGSLEYWLVQGNKKEGY